MRERDEGRLGERKPRPLAAALVVGGVAAAITALVAQPHLIPPSWVAALVPGVATEMEVVGGASVDVEVAPALDSLDAAERAAVETRLGQLGVELTERGTIEVVGVGPDDAVEWLQEGLRRGLLRVVEVKEASDRMQRIHGRVASGDPRAVELGVVAPPQDEWDHEVTGERYSDWYLRAARRRDLERYLEELAVADPTFAPEAGFAFVFERTDSRWGDEAPGWRSYYVRDRAALGDRHVADATVYWNDTTSQADVLLEFTPEGARLFAEFTGRMVGRKLAILVDGEVIAAPIVMSRVDGGRTSLSMGGDDSLAGALVEVVRGEPLSAGFRIGRARAVPASVSSAQLQAARWLLALVVGLLLAVPLWALGRFARPLDPAVERAASRSRLLPWRRALVTAGGAVLAAAGALVTMVSYEELFTEELFTADASVVVPHLPLSLIGVGIFPFLAAFVLVEAVALLVPRWRPLRVGGPTGRARLGIATAILGVALAVAHSWLVALWLTGFDPVPGAPVVEAAGAFHPTFAVLSAGTIVLGLIALLIDRHGLGSGFVAVLLGGLALEPLRIAERIGVERFNLASGLAVGLALALTAVMTSLVLRWRTRGAGPLARFRAPAAGLVPLGLAGCASTLLWFWPVAEMSVSSWLAPLPGGTPDKPAVELAALIALSLVLSWLFSRPSRLGGAATALDRAAARRLWSGFAWVAALSTVYLVGLFLLDRLARLWMPWPLDSVGVVPIAAAALVTAAIMDLVAEWRAMWRRDDLRPIWPLHQVQRADQVLDALVRNGVQVHARGLYVRSMLHFFAPFVPVLLFVPEAQAQEARAIVAAQLGAGQASAGRSI
jgi:hypothetical protein